MNSGSASRPSPIPARAASGTQVVLKFAEQSATVVQVGAGLRSYTVDGRYAFDGASHQLPLTEPGKHNAIHGLVRWTTWIIAQQQASGASFACLLNAQSGWPFTADLRIDYELGPAGLSVRASATNCGALPCPYGTGAHPYLRLGTDTINDLRLGSPGTDRMILDYLGIPARSEPVDGTSYDFTAGRIIGSAVLDAGYLNLSRHSDGLGHFY